MSQLRIRTLEADQSSVQSSVDTRVDGLRREIEERERTIAVIKEEKVRADQDYAHSIGARDAELRNMLKAMLDQRVS